MDFRSTISHPGRAGLTVVFAAVLLLVLSATCSAAPLSVNIDVVGSDGTPVTGYRWLAEEDRTIPVTPGDTSFEGTLGVQFHTSYMPPVATGDSGGSAATTLTLPDNTQRYFISILPDTDYAMGGVSAIPVGGVVPPLLVTVNAMPIPTAQITVFVFEDSFPINNAPDLPNETGLEGFTIVIEDAGGRYGVTAGQQMLDAFANPLGTAYQYNVDGTPILNPDGTPAVAVMGSGVITTDADGMVTIRNLAPGKYGIQAVPPVGLSWQQTTTIEGTKVIDAWVKADESPFLVEFGLPGTHVFIGFTKEFADPTGLTGSGTIEGQIVGARISRPPALGISPGEPYGYTTPWVALNEGAGVGRGIYAGPANGDGTFSISGVPGGTYQLVIWDNNLDLIIDFRLVTVSDVGGVFDIGQIPVLTWFARQEHHVFYDADEDGFRDPGEVYGIPEQGVNIRFRDGTIYQAFPTDLDGYVPFDEVFPFFRWMVAEVDFLRYKATGVTVTVDDGGPLAPGDSLNPQQQVLVNPNTSNFDSYTMAGEVLTLGTQSFAGQNSRFEWGKTAYGHEENGGISGIVYYAVTRAENDPRWAAAEPWEPGIPDVALFLYEDMDQDGVIDDLDGDGGPTRADVNNYPFSIFDGAAEDVDWNGNGVVDYGDAISWTRTDSWDNDQPFGCPEADFLLDGTLPVDCFDGLRTYEQVRPAVFDGGFAFTERVDGGLFLGNPAVPGIPSGTYIVESATPPPYRLLMEESKNVDFGEEYIPATLLTPPICVGEVRAVGPILTTFPGAAEPAPYAGDLRPLCDMKQVTVNEGFNAGAEFFLYTDVPVAGHIAGTSLNDLNNTFNPDDPNFGEKFGPPFLPVAIYDFNNNLVVQTYSDRFGNFNALVPSTFTTNLPAPSGMSPNVLSACMNAPVTDPAYSPFYSTTCYNLMYMPGTTTYLDTPVIPVAANVGDGKYPPDCELPDGTPVIDQVSSSAAGGGPYLITEELGLATLTIDSPGAAVMVTNPAFGAPLELPKIPRDLGFGSAGMVTLGGVPLTVTAWTADQITATVPAVFTAGDYQLAVTRDDNSTSTVAGLTVTIVDNADLGTVHHVTAGQSINTWIGASNPGDLILIGPGTYNELIFMTKPVKLQGYGPGVTTINASHGSVELVQWRIDAQVHIDSGLIDLLPGQNGVIDPRDERAGITVLAKDGDFTQALAPRIDGLTLLGASNGGGIFVNGYAHYLRISNNTLRANHGNLGGAIRVGHPRLTTLAGDAYQSGFNDNMVVANNLIVQNGSINGIGAGISMCTGSDDYLISSNFICGNFTTGNGAGIGHMGLSQGVIGGRIEDNAIVFNQTFNQGNVSHGGGIFIGSGLPVGVAPVGPGSGPVTVQGNLIQGNHAATGDGGGIALVRTGGEDIVASPDDSVGWDLIEITDNRIVNNVAGRAGGGISLQDAPYVMINNVTVAHNDSTATTGDVIQLGLEPVTSVDQPAGIVSHAHTQPLADLFGPAVATYADFSNPAMDSNIIWQNRAFHLVIDTGAPIITDQARLLPDIGAGDAPQYWDMAVLGSAVAATLNPLNSILTTTAGFDGSNVDSPPDFVSSYFNGARSNNVDPTLSTSMELAVALDEGGNFSDVKYGPTTLYGDYLSLFDGTKGGSGGIGPLTLDGEPTATPTTGDSTTTTGTADKSNGDSGCFLKTLME